MDRYFQRLEKLFGKAHPSETVSGKFGESYFNGIKGWQFPEETIAEYNCNGKLLTMDLDLPCSCRLDCIYCFAKEDAYYRPQAGDKPLSMKEIKGHVLEAKKLGLQSIKIVGFGESFENPEIFDFIEFASKHGIWLVIFTSAYTLGESNFNGSFEELVEFLHRNKVSLMLKFHTTSAQKDDSIVGQKGFAGTRNNYLKALLEHGSFNEGSPTRLGIENVIASQNIQELASIYEYFKIYRNLFVDLDPPIPVGRTDSREKCERIGMGQEKLGELCNAVYSLNRKHGIPFKGFSSFFGGVPCSQLSNGLYLTLSGKVMACCGSNEQLGDIRKNSLQEIFEKSPYRNSPSLYHTCPYRKEKGIITEEFMLNINRKFSSMRSGKWQSQ